MACQGQWRVKLTTDYLFPKPDSDRSSTQSGHTDYRLPITIHRRLEGVRMGHHSSSIIH